jgi:hypothetical protein
MIRFSNGDGEAPNMLGLLHQPDTLLRTYTPADGYTQIDSIVQALNDLRVGSAFAIADLVVLHTTTWDEICRIKNSLGSFVLNQNDPNELGGLDNIFGVRVGAHDEISGRDGGGARHEDRRSGLGAVWGWKSSVLNSPIGRSPTTRGSSA